MGGTLQKLKTWWQAADRTQKLITVIGGGFLAVLLFGTYVFASKPKMALVFANLSPADAGSVAMEVENMGIPVKFDSAGNVEVPSDQVARVRAGLAMNGKLPRGGDHFASDQLDKMSLMTSQPVEREKIRSIMESDLSQSVQFFDGVDRANVKITFAVDSPFVSEQKPAQASVTVSEKAGALVSADQARAMANLVASAVPGLDKSKVTIFTRTGRALWDGQEQSDGSARASDKLDLEKREARKKRDELQEMLNRMLGPGNAIAMVDLSLNLDSPEEESIRYGEAKPVEQQKLEEQLNSLGGGSSATPGMGGNDPAAPPIGGNSAKSDYVVTKSGTVNTYDTTRKTTKHVGGAIERMAVTVLVNQTDKIVVDPADPEDPVVKLANSFLGKPAQADQANFTASVVAYPFDKTQAEAVAKAEQQAASSSRMQQIFSILPVAALIFVAIMVVRALGKAAPRAFPPMLATAGGPSLPMSSESSRALEAANRFVLPEVVKQKAIEAGISEEQLEAAMQEAGENGLQITDIPSIANKVNVPLEQIKKMAHDRPETVAMLIKSWLIEEGIRR